MRSFQLFTIFGMEDLQKAIQVSEAVGQEDDAQAAVLRTNQILTV